MIVGVPKEIKEQEYRVALLPGGVYQLAKRGHTVVVERGAGVGAGYPDSEYEAAGAQFVDTHAEVFARADLIIKVKEPLAVGISLVAAGADSAHLPAPRGEQAVDGSADEIRRDVHRVRNH